MAADRRGERPRGEQGRGSGHQARRTPERRPARSPRSGPRTDPERNTQAARPVREPPRPGLARRDNEPPMPEGVDTRKLHRAVRAELRGLPKDLAEIVAGHLVLAGQLIDDDPELAYAHAEAARRRAARLPIVREAAAETAYAAGPLRRRPERVPGAAPDDRHPRLPAGDGRLRAGARPARTAALKLAKEAVRLDARSGAADRDDHRRGRCPADLGQHAEARRILDQAVQRSPPQPAAGRTPTARLHYAYAEALSDRDKAGRGPHGGSPAPPSWTPRARPTPQQRVDELDGMLIDFDETTTPSQNPEDSEGDPPGTEPS